MTFVKVANRSDLPAIDEAKEFPCDDRAVCITNVSGSYSAMDNVCPHRGGPLGQGMVEGGKVICPWHGWAWDVKTGQAAQDSRMKVAVYPVKIENNELSIEI